MRGHAINTKEIKNIILCEHLLLFHFKNFLKSIILVIEYNYFLSTTICFLVNLFTLITVKIT